MGVKSEEREDCTGINGVGTNAPRKSQERAADLRRHGRIAEWLLGVSAFAGPSGVGVSPLELAQTVLRWSTHSLRSNTHKGENNNNNNKRERGGGGRERERERE